MDSLQELFGDALYDEAKRLVEQGCVLELRILQDGSVVTGVFGAERHAHRYRVYIRRCGPEGKPTARLDGECSCGMRTACVHLAAVCIAAERGTTGSAQGALRINQRVCEQRWPAAATLQEQHLYYLLDSAASEATDELQVSLWVAQTIAGGADLDPESARPFTARATAGVYPRYVSAPDRDILQSLTAQAAAGLWILRGEGGARLLQQIIASGRAYWRSFHTQALHAGEPRAMPLAWSVLSNGDQQLTGELPRSTSIVLSLGAPTYLDAASGQWGRLELACSARLLQHYQRLGPVPPEQAAAINEQIEIDPEALTFPRLRILAVIRQPCHSLQYRLVLSAGPHATAQFIYNGFAFEAAALPDEQEFVRTTAGAQVLEIARNRETEHRLLQRLEHVLPDRHQAGSAWFAFMMREVPALEQDGWQILVRPDFPYRLARAQNWYADMTADPHHGWFDLKLGVVIDNQTVNLLPALVDYLQASLGGHETWRNLTEGHWLVRLEDGRHLPVPVERIGRIADTLVELFERDGLNSRQALSLPLSQVSRIAQLVGEAGHPTLHCDDPALLALLDDLKNFTGIAPLPAPAHFQATLRPYQQDGLGWLQFLRRYRFGGILADDMGLGKTVQTLAHLVMEKNQGRLPHPALIVAPVSVIGNWQREARRFAPQLNVLVLHGSRRRESFASIARADLVITAYPLLQLDSEILLAQAFTFVILDEAQMIRNPRAKVSQAARALRAEHRLCLTGTPLENHLGELWSLFDFAQPGLLGTEAQFQRQYRQPIEREGNSQRAAALARRIAPFVLRRTKETVAKDLPQKTQVVEAIMMDERQRDYYDGIRLSMHQRVREAIEREGLQRSQLTMLDALLKLRQVCCDPRLITTDAQARNVPSAKMDWLQTVLPELVAEGRRILLFSQFTSMLQLIEVAVRQWSIPYLLLTGATAHRTALVERFQSGSVPLFLISLKAGGTGLNLTAADTVIHYDPWWNPAAEAQATDRAHRIGQDQPVFVHKLITQGTVEERIMKLQQDKQSLADQLYTERSASPQRLTAEDFAALLEP